jgi:hypothetical protein
LDGYAEGTGQRTQFNSQISIVFPTGTTLSIADKYMPLQNNQGYSGTLPNDWNFGPMISDPSASPGNDFIYITPTLVPSSQYNNVYTGDTIKLFSVSVSGDSTCGEGVRLFENGVDPSSSDPGMNGIDFSNSFTIGGFMNLYNENAPIEGPFPPEVLELIDNSGADIDINLETYVNSCQGPIEYAWTGPDGYSSATEDVFISPASSINFGEYEVIIKDDIGCADTIAIIIEEPQIVSVLGILNINNTYEMPSVDGTLNQILTTDGNGIVTWMDATTTFIGDLPADNDQRWSSLDTISDGSQREIDILENEVKLLRSEIEALKLLIEKLTKD